MPARVITIADLRNVSKEFRIPPGTIVTPAARDHADSRGIKIVFAANPEATGSTDKAASKTGQGLAQRIDHTLLHPDAVQSDVLTL